MNLGVLAARTQQAQERLAAAANLLGDRFALGDEVQAIAAARGTKDAAVRALYQLEATAALVERLAGVTAPGEPLPDDSDRLGAMTVGEAADHIGTVDDPAILDALERGEQAGKARKGVLGAIAARRDELAAALAAPAAPAANPVQPLDSGEA